MPGLKQVNEYALSVKEYAKVPKAVWAAIAVSYAKRIEPDGTWKDELWHEWQTLYQNGIVPQRPIPFDYRT